LNKFIIEFYNTYVVFKVTGVCGYEGFATNQVQEISPHELQSAGNELDCFWIIRPQQAFGSLIEINVTFADDNTFLSSENYLEVIQ